MTKFYVYGLIDPRTNSIFYIGKGKGKRVFQHLNEKRDVHSNTEKLKVIAEIQKAGLEVGHVIIQEDLVEDAALLLERLLVFRTGRSIFDEGSLTNIVPGGLWNKDAPLFLNEENFPNIEVIKKQFPEIIPTIEKFPHVAKEFTGFTCPIDPQDDNLYVFDKTGNKIQELDVNSFIKIFGLGYALDIINGLKNTSSCIYAWNRVWSKTKFEKIEDVSRIPFQAFDQMDFKFIREVNTAISKASEGLVQCTYPDGTIHAEANLYSEGNEITLSYYFANGNKKHQTKFADQKLDGKCFIWREDGSLKEETEYFNNNRIGKKKYYDNGNLEMSEARNEIDGSRSVKHWYETGVLQRETKEDATFYSNPKPKSDISVPEIGCIMAWDYSNEGVLLKETKSYYPNGLGGPVHGYERLFYETGELKSETDYTNGPDKKIIKTFQKNGDI